MRLRLARICGTGDVLTEHAAFRCQRPEFFDVVNRGTAVSFALLDDPQLHHLVICLISRQADNRSPLHQHSFHLSVVFPHTRVGQGVKQRLVIVVQIADPVNWL